MNIRIIFGGGTAVLRSQNIRKGGCDAVILTHSPRLPEGGLRCKGGDSRG